MRAGPAAACRCCSGSGGCPPWMREELGDLSLPMARITFLMRLVRWGKHLSLITAPEFCHVLRLRGEPGCRAHTG